MFDSAPDVGEWHRCPRCKLKAIAPKGELKPFQGLRCPQCGWILVPVHLTGMNVFGTATLYERGNDEVNAIIREAKRWKRPGEI